MAVSIRLIIQTQCVGPVSSARRQISYAIAQSCRCYTNDMTVSTADRHKADNEAIFRERNERMRRGVDKANAIAVELEEKELEMDTSVPMQFYCECADENCQKRIKLSLDDYNAIHSDARRFTILPRHHVPEIENVTAKKRGYWVVTKHEKPPEISDELQPTDVDNV